MTTEIYYRIHDLIEGSICKARKAGDMKKLSSAKERLRMLEAYYADEYAEHDEDSRLDGLDPGFASWDDYYNYMYG